MFFQTLSAIPRQLLSIQLAFGWILVSRFGKSDILRLARSFLLLMFQGNGCAACLRLLRWRLHQGGLWPTKGRGTEARQDLHVRHHRRLGRSLLEMVKHLCLSCCMASLRDFWCRLSLDHLRSLTISSKLAEKGPNTKAIRLASYQSGKNDGSGWLLGMLWPDVLRPQRLVLGHLALAVLANQTK